jgi:chromosome segregation ATPase
MMAQSSSQPQAAAAQQLQELFERVALDSVAPIYDKQTAAIGKLKSRHTELSGVVEEMKATHGKFAMQQTALQNQQEKLHHGLESIKEQLSTIASMKSQIEVLRIEKEELRVIVRYVQGASLTNSSPDLQHRSLHFTFPLDLLISFYTFTNPPLLKLSILKPCTDSI